MFAIPKPGTRISGYQLLEEVACGGQGAVFRAVRLEDGGPVAVKLLLDLDAESVGRFEREALQLARVDHPGVVHVHDYGLDQGRPFLVMEWVDGASLQERVRTGGPLPAEEAVGVVSGVARALARCHGLGIVHRDVKPQNVLLAPGRGAVLVDFGLVGVGQGAGAGRRLTLTGEILGTVEFMAPEQADARFGAVGPAADVYALGATLYYALTGSPPLGDVGGQARGLLRLIEQAPRDPRELQPSIAKPLADLCLRCLAKQPGDRPADAVAFLEALEAAGRARPRRWIHPLLALVGAAAVAGLALLAARLPAPAAQVAVTLRSSAATAPPAPSPRASPVAAPERAPARPDARSSQDTTVVPLGQLQSIKAQMVLGQFWEAWKQIERELTRAPRDVHLLETAEVTLRGLLKQLDRKPRDLANLYDVLVRLQRHGQPTTRRAAEAGRVARELANRTRDARRREVEWLQRSVSVLKAQRARLPAVPRDEPERELLFHLGTAQGRQGSLAYQASRFEVGDALTGEALAALARIDRGPRTAQAAHAAAKIHLLRLRRRKLEPALRHSRLAPAREAWRRFCALAPGDARAHSGLGVLCQRAADDPGRFGLAEEEQLELLAEATHAFVDAHRTSAQPTRAGLLVFSRCAHAKALLIEGRWAAAVEVLRDGFLVPEAGPRAIVYLSLVYLKAVRSWARVDRAAAQAAVATELVAPVWARPSIEPGDWREELEQELRRLL